MAKSLGSYPLSTEIPRTASDMLMTADFYNGRSRFDHRQTDLRRDLFMDPFSGFFNTQRHLSPEEVGGAKLPEEKVRIGDGGVRSSPAVTDGAWLCPGAAWSYFECSRSSTQAILPPPAPISTVSITGSIIG